MQVTTSGIHGLPDLVWGSHFCHFYDSARELRDTVTPFIQTGLTNNEACLWLTAEPLSVDDARSALQAVVPDLGDRERSGQLEIVDLEEWYHRTGPIDAVDAWIKRSELALAQGFAGLRLSSNIGEHVSSDPPIGAGFDQRQIVGLFGYDLTRLSGADVLDVVYRYQLTLPRSTVGDGRRSGMPGDGAEVIRLQRVSLRELLAEEQLREADKRKNEFLAMLGHELRNPLASILTASQLMVLRGGEQQFRKELEIVQRQISHITSMVDDLLDVSRIIAGRVKLDFTLLEIAEAINRGIEIAAPVIDKRAHRLHVSCPASGLTVNGDPTRLAQIVANLVTNAARYTDPGGDITVKAERANDTVSLSVSDTGRGIDPKRLNMIFQPFFQGREGRQRGEGGLGLGLSIVRSLVDLHGGTVEAASTLGKGSEFVVRLPMVEQSPAPPPH